MPSLKKRSASFWVGRILSTRIAGTDGGKLMTKHLDDSTADYASGSKNPETLNWRVQTVAGGKLMNCASLRLP